MTVCTDQACATAHIPNHAHLTAADAEALDAAVIAALLTDLPDPDERPAYDPADGEDDYR